MEGDAYLHLAVRVPAREWMRFPLRIGASVLRVLEAINIEESERGFAQID
jgi:hypothetical protein